MSGWSHADTALLRQCIARKDGLLAMCALLRHSKSAVSDRARLIPGHEYLFARATPEPAPLVDHRARVQPAATTRHETYWQARAREYLARTQGATIEQRVD